MTIVYSFGALPLGDRYVLRDHGVRIDSFGGNCPVQAEGILWRGHAWYFRARGNHMTLYVNKAPKQFDGWQYREPYRPEEKFAAGWIEWPEFVAFMQRALLKWEEERPRL